MKSCLPSLPAVLFCGAGVVQALPPAPYYTLYGTVRDDVGQIIRTQGAEVILLNGGVEIGRTPIDSTLRPDQNYELRLRLDHARVATRLYSPEALATDGQFTVRVRMNDRLFLPIQVTGSLTAGKGGERVRFDLTIGADSDNDGLPDLWEEWQLYLAGHPPLPDGRWDVSLVRPADDLDSDGTSNLDEYAAGTYAADPTSYLFLESKEREANFWRFEFFRITGKTYRLERSTDVAPGSWMPVDFALTKGGVPAAFHRAEEAGRVSIFVVPLAGREFYRLNVQ